MMAFAFKDIVVGIIRCFAVVYAAADAPVSRRR